PNHIRFIDIPVINFPEASLANFNTDGADLGAITFNWENVVPQNIDDGDIVFLMCFEITGDPNECQELEFQDLPLESQVITLESNGNNVGFTGIPGEFCVLEPEGYEVYISDERGYVNDTTCVSVRVADFDDITNTDFTLNWEPSSLSFVSVNPSGVLGLSDANFNTASTNVGILNFQFQDVLGASLPDTSTLFDVCFNLIGAPEGCYTISVNPDPVVETINGRGDLKLVEEGEICIRDTIIIESFTINPVTCPDKQDGSVALSISGGQGNVIINWNTSPIQFDTLARFLPTGMVSVTIFDLESDPPIVVIDSFEIPITTELPFATAGDDQIINCDPPIILLEGNGNMEDNYEFEWSTIGGSLPGQTNQQFAAAGSAGTYVFTVENTDTRCTASDTVEVFQAPTPIALAGDTLTYTCINDTLTLDGSANLVADSIAYFWSALDSGMVVMGEDSLLSPRVAAPGMYQLEVINTNTQCIGIDTVVVQDGRFTPNANAGEDRVLECLQNSVLLDGSSSVNDRPVRYEWSDLSGELLSSNVSFDAPGLGDYVLTVFDIESGCSNTDTVNVFPTPDFPGVDIAANDEEPLVITCDRDTVILVGLVTNAGDNFQFIWSPLEGGSLAQGTDNSLTPRATAPGVYELSVTNNLNGCTSTDTIRVGEDVVAPLAEAGEGFLLTCVDTSYVLDGTGSSEGEFFNYTWTLDGQVVAENTLQTEIFNPGTYSIEVRNSDNGCTATDNVVIDITGDRPQIDFATPDTLTCDVESVNVAAIVTPSTEAYQVNWAIVDNGNITSTDSLLIGVNQPGNYRLRVVNAQTGCFTQSDIEVAIDTISPAASAGMDQLLNCVNTSVVLDGSNSVAGPNFSYLWTAVSEGEAPTTPDQNTLTVSTVGTYQLQVTDSNNGCISSDQVMVTIDTLTPTAFIETPTELTCADTVISLNATQSIANRTMVQWMGVAGQMVSNTANPLIVDVTEGGSFQLMLTDTVSGCTAMDMVEVLQNTVAPVANAGSDATLLCFGQAVSFDASASEQGDGITYQWTTQDGSTIVDAMTLTPTVDEPGTYQLEVTNTVNGCNAFATVMANLSDALQDADAGSMVTTCEETELLFGNAPTGTTGMWTNDSGIFIETPDMNATAVSGLRAGDNVFTWTLSTAECPEYSSATVTIRREAAPGAVNDIIDLNEGQTSITFDLAANDQTTNVSGFTIELLGSPSLGSIDTITNESVLTYTVKEGLFGESEFEYVICSQDCPNLCDTALVFINVPVDPDYEIPAAPNAITPNGDNANETLFFDVLDGAEDFYPDNELIIFNRWGDIVYQKKPYVNNWNGTTDSGENLPDGTYYYILRLDIANGVILRGDVTIIR
ncbi:MAG: gliding motility-associated C-terminal domain-containing protein, partial [Bacteroidota bacterium]